MKYERWHKFFKGYAALENLFIMISTKLDSFTRFLVFTDETSSLNFIMFGLL